MAPREDPSRCAGGAAVASVTGAVDRAARGRSALGGGGGGGAGPRARKRVGLGGARPRRPQAASRPRNSGDVRDGVRLGA